MKVAFQTIDVFTDTRFGGNPLAVIPDATGLSTGQMQAIAGEFNLSETTFVLPPRDPAHTAQVRIFTPRAELPFAGHPNVGTAFVLARAGTCHGRPVTGDKLVFEEIAGLVPLDLARENGTVVSARLAAPKPLTLGDTLDPAVVAAMVGLDPADIVAVRHPPILASCGNDFLYVELASRAALARASVRTDRLAEHLPMNRAVGVHLYVASDEPGIAVQSRMFAPLHGVPEDPATGSANVTLIGLLAHVRPERDLVLSLTIGQGFDMGRPSRLEARAEKKDGRVVATFIGGRCVPVTSGTIELD
ncbi:MAG: PhzF family phenazine biosynthesis protein [Proteobacteria bacterium]|nr:PhzF family phenazine biosynthesis protein [Pseudomonadota bacterium]